MTIQAKIITRNQNEVETSIIQSLPKGRLFKIASKSDSNLRRLLRGLSYEILRIENKISKDVYEQYFINEGKDSLLEEWESALGIPDDCFKIEGVSRDDRVNNVLIKLYMNKVTTEQDHIYLASLLGISIIIEHMSDKLYPPYDIPFFPVDEDTSRFVMIIRGVDVDIAGALPPYDVPFIPQSSSILSCIFDKVKPVNVKYLYLND